MKSTGKTTQLLLAGGLTFILGFALVSDVSGQSTVFASRAAFEVAAGSSPVLLENFDAFARGQRVSQLFGGLITFASPFPTIFFGSWNFFGTGGEFSGGAIIPEPRFQGNSLILNFNSPVFGVGGNAFDDFDGTPFVNVITLTVTTSLGTAFSISETFPNVGDTGFLGATSSEGIVQAEFSIDNANGNLEVDLLTVVDAPVPPDNHPPIAKCKNVTVLAGPNCATPASIDDGSFDADGDPITVSQTPPGPYPLGTTPVTLTVSDNRGESSTCSATVTVIDITPPKISCPSDMVVSTDRGLCSATVAFTPLAFDQCDGRVPIVCSPPSGSVFPKGTTKVTCTARDNSGNVASCSFNVTVEDREAPVAACIPTTNPAGGTIPKAGDNPKSGQNPDGFYQLAATDNCDSSPKIYVKDSASGFVAGPFKSGDKVKVTQAPGITPNSKPMAGEIVAHIQLKGDALVYAVDAAGNQSPFASCLVAPPPK